MAKTLKSDESSEGLRSFEARLTAIKDEHGLLNGRPVGTTAAAGRYFCGYPNCGARLVPDGSQWKHLATELA